MTQTEIDRNFRAWQELMDFGWRFCLEVFPQTYPGCDPLQKIREAWDRKSEEHLRANERMMEAIGRAAR